MVTAPGTRLVLELRAHGLADQAIAAALVRHLRLSLDEIERAFAAADDSSTTEQLGR